MNLHGQVGCVIVDGVARRYQHVRRGVQCVLAPEDFLFACDSGGAFPHRAVVLHDGIALEWAERETILTAIGWRHEPGRPLWECDECAEARLTVGALLDEWQGGDRSPERP